MLLSFSGKMMKSLVLLSMFIFSLPETFAYFGAPGTQVKVPRSKAGSASRYGFLEYLPAGYSDAAGAAKVPIVLFLHGLGDVGDGENNYAFNNSLNTGLPKLISNGMRLPAIVISPQSVGWWDASYIEEFVNYIFTVYKNADPNRLYVTGLSMGGGGTWDYATAFPHRVAAIVPICGASESNRSAIYPKSAWAFHAWDDTIVHRNQSITNIDTLKPISQSIMSIYPSVSGGPASQTMTYMYRQSIQNHEWVAGDWITDVSTDANVRFTMYPSGGHSIWNGVYQHKPMWDWLFNQSLNSAVAPTPVSPTPQPQPEPQPEPQPQPQPEPTPVVQPVFSSGSIVMDFGSGSNRTEVKNIFGYDIIAGGTKSGLISQSGAVTPVSISMVKRFNGVNSNGTYSAIDAIGIDGAAASDSYFGNDVMFNGVIASQAEFNLSGLDPKLSYELKFFASRMGASDNRQSRYEVIGASTSFTDLNAADNVGLSASVSSIKPNSNGVITVRVRKGPANNNAYGFFYIGAMKLSVVSSTTVTEPVVEPEPTPEPTPEPAPAPAPVAPAARSFAVDFGSAGVSLPASWNDGGNLLMSGSMNLKTIKSEPSNVSLSTLVRFGGVNSNGTSSPESSLNLPSGTSNDSFYGSPVAWVGVITPQAVMVLKGLTPGRSHTIEFFASRMASDTSIRETLYRAIGGSTVSTTLNATNNTSKVARVSVTANANGEIRIEFEKGPNNNNPYGFYYLGNMRVIEN